MPKHSTNRTNVNQGLDPAIEFADEAPPPPSEAAPLATAEAPFKLSNVEILERNQHVAKQVIEDLRYADINELARQKAPVHVPVSAEEESKLRAKVYIVMEDRRLATGLMRQGKRVSENDYNIADLRRQGVKLEVLVESA